MMPNFEAIIDDILAKEKGFVDNPADHGGPTNYGITIASARVSGYTGQMQDLPLALAREIYRKRYIAEPQFDRIAESDPKVGFELIDTGVNMGPAVAATMFQRWLNGFNAGGSHYADVFPDGRIGPVTIAAFKAYCRWRGAPGSVVMRCALNCTQGVRYLEITERDISQRNFLYGWMLNRVVESTSPAIIPAP